MVCVLSPDQCSSVVTAPQTELRACEGQGFSSGKCLRRLCFEWNLLLILSSIDKIPVDSRSIFERWNSRCYVLRYLL